MSGFFKALKTPIPSGSPDLDHLLAGGLPAGAITEIAAPWGSEAAQRIAAAIAWQRAKSGFPVFWISLDPDGGWVRKLGAAIEPIPENLVELQPKDGEEAMGLAKLVLATPGALAVLDSIPRFSSRREKASVANNAESGARGLLSRGLKRLAPILAGAGSALLVLEGVRLRSDEEGRLARFPCAGLALRLRAAASLFAIEQEAGGFEVTLIKPRPRRKRTLASI